MTQLPIALDFHAKDKAETNTFVSMFFKRKNIKYKEPVCCNKTETNF